MPKYTRVIKNGTRDQKMLCFSKTVCAIHKVHLEIWSKAPHLAAACTLSIRFCCHIATKFFYCSAAFLDAHNFFADILSVKYSF